MCVAVVMYLLPYWLWLEQEIISSGQINPNLFRRPMRPLHTTVMEHRHCLEGTANLIWVKCGAQSLPISLDLINPNCVIVFDDKEVSVREPHCQIIVLLSHSAQSKVDKERPAATVDYRGKQRSYIIVNGGRVLDTLTEKVSMTIGTKRRALLYLRVIFQWRLMWQMRYGILNLRKWKLVSHKYGKKNWKRLYSLSSLPFHIQLFQYFDFTLTNDAVRRRRTIYSI